MTTEQLARFEARITRTASGCWLADKPYPRFYSAGSSRPMVQVAYTHFRGPVPSGWTLDHHDHCCEPACVNPWHVELATRADNSANSWLSSPIPADYAYSPLTQRAQRPRR